MNCLNVLLVFGFINFEFNDAGYHQKRLLNYLFDPKRRFPHNKLERPVKNESEAVKVRFSTSLTQILDVDEKNQIIISSIMLNMMWYDYQFKWNPRDYGDIKLLNVNPSLVWIPDILLYNSADENFNAANPVMVNIYYDGRVSYAPPGLFQSTCLINVTWFPFDKQICILKFGTWSYHGLDVDLKIACPNDEFMMNDGNCSIRGQVDLSMYLQSGEWALLGASMKRNSKKYDCCPEVYVDVKVKLKIQRKALYYLFNFVLPCIIISIMALLDFLLPSDAGEKISLGVTIMLSLSMFQLILADLMPQSSLTTPLLAIYFCSMMALSSISIIFTVLVLSCHHNDHEIPSILKICVNQWLCRILFITPISLSSKPANNSRVQRPSLQSLRNTSDRQTASKICYYNDFTSTMLAATNAIGAASVSKPSNTVANNTSQLNPSTSLLANVLNLPSDTHEIYHDLMGQRRKSLSDLDDTNDEVFSLESSSHSHNNGNHTKMSCSLRKDLREMRLEMEFITSKIRENDEESDLLKEWKFAAYVIDRFCVVTFSLLAFVVTCAIFILGASN